MEDDWSEIGKNTTTTQSEDEVEEREARKPRARVKESKHILYAPALLVHVQLSNNLHNLNSFFLFHI